MKWTTGDDAADALLMLSTHRERDDDTEAVVSDENDDDQFEITRLDVDPNEETITSVVDPDLLEKDRECERLRQRSERLKERSKRLEQEKNSEFRRLQQEWSEDRDRLESCSVKVS